MNSRHTPTRRRLLRATLQTLSLGALGLATMGHATEPVPVLIAHAGLPKADAATIARLYTGRAIELGGQAVTVVHAATGSALRARFLSSVLQQDEERYRAYWTVRRHVGKGAPPRELASSSEVIEFVQSTPGAIGYVDASELRPGLNIVLRP